MNEKDTWYVASLLEFSDGGEPSVMILARGIQDEAACKHIVDLIPAVSYSGERPVSKASLIWGRGEV